MAGERGGPDLRGLRIHDDARTTRRRTWPVLATLAAVIVLAVAAWALWPSSPTVQVAAVRPARAGGGSPALLNASGYVTPRRRATVAAKVTGRVEWIDAEEGMVVREGQILARLDDSDARRRLASVDAARDVATAALRDLEVNLANAERETRRAEQLLRSGIGSEQAEDNARTAQASLEARLAIAREQLRAAEADRGIANQDLDNTVVRAPFSGVIVSKDAQRGEMVSPISAGGGFTRTGIATIVDMSSLEIEVDVNEAYIARVEPGQKVEATLDAYPDWRIPASVRTVIPSADRQKATVKVRVAFDALDPRILPDMGIKVAFLANTPAAGERLPARAVVSKTAVVDRDGGKYVFVVRDGRVERRAVTAGPESGEDVEIQAGVTEGETVVVRPPEGLRDGDRVRVGT